MSLDTTPLKIYAFSDRQPTSPDWRDSLFAKVEQGGQCLATFDGPNCYDRAIGFVEGWHTAHGLPLSCPDLIFVDAGDK